MTTGGGHPRGGDIDEPVPERANRPGDQPAAPDHLEEIRDRYMAFAYSAPLLEIGPSGDSDVGWLIDEVDRARSALEEARHTLGAIWLYVDWRKVTRKLETVQKELWADAVDAFGEPETGKADRWWREDPGRPAAQEAAASIDGNVTGDDRVSLGEALHSLDLLDDEDLSGMTFKAVEWFEQWLARRSAGLPEAAQEAGELPAPRVWEKWALEPDPDDRPLVVRDRMGDEWGRVREGWMLIKVDGEVPGEDANDVGPHPWLTVCAYAPLTEVLPEVPSGGDPDHG